MNLTECDSLEDDEFGMRILTKQLSAWAGDAWLVEFDEPLRPMLKKYAENEDGSMEIKRVVEPKVRYAVVNESDLIPEVMVFPAYANGSYRGIGAGKQPLVHGVWGNHYDALDALAEEYVGLVANVDGPRGQNEVRN